MPPNPPASSSASQLRTSRNVQPKDKTTNQWLHDHGYKSLHQFMIEYGFKPHSADAQEDAERMVESLKQEEQDAFEAETAAGGKETKKTSQQDIDLAFLWHLRMGHLDWETLKHVPEHTTGMPDLKFRIEDMPPCEVCVEIYGPLGAARPADNF